MAKNTKFHIGLLAVFSAALIFSAIDAYDLFTWVLEVIPGVIGVIILVATYRKFRFSNMTYVLILLHTFILMIGGHYTYARVPLFDWIRDIFHLARNNYDKVGHFAQGFVPALIARELFVRKRAVRGKGWQLAITVLIALGISAIYEIFEWQVSVWTGSKGDAFLGTQGDIFDTQSDMLWAGIGSLAAMLTMTKPQDLSIKKTDPAAMELN